MIHFIVFLFITLQIIVVMFAFYQGTISLVGIPRLRNKGLLPTPEKKMAIVIAAHNEKKVIASGIQSLLQQNYPHELYDIIVVADNCTDETAHIARKEGAKVFERFNRSLVGKGFALQWIFERIYRMQTNYDAIVVLDADNVVSQNFLLHMNHHLCRGHKIIQGYLDSKNPDDSWVTLSYAIAYWYMGRMWQLARYRLGLANALGGTGMCFEMNTLKELGWDATSLTEDLEFTMKAVLEGIRPVWAHEAKVYDEKPIKFQASWRQRLRWMQGHWDVAFRYVLPLLKKFILKGDVRAFDCILYLLQPSRILLSYFTLLTSLVLTVTAAVPSVTVLHPMMHFILLPTYVWYAVFAMQWVFPPIIAFVMILERMKMKRFIGLLWYQVFGLSWLPLTFIGLFTKGNTIWVHTKHTRNIQVQNLETPEWSLEDAK